MTPRRPSGIFISIWEDSIAMTPEQVAYELMRSIAMGEGKTLHSQGPIIGMKRDWILSTYAECLRTVRAIPPALATDLQPGVVVRLPAKEP